MEFLALFQEKNTTPARKASCRDYYFNPSTLGRASLFRAINKKDFAPDVVVLSDEVNEAYPQLLNLFAFYCKQNGMDVMAKPVVTEFPEKDKPRMELAQV